MADEIQSIVDESGMDSGWKLRHAAFARHAAGMMVGIAFFVASLVILVWNEGCFLDAMRRLNTAYDAKLVALRGEIEGGEVISDDIFYVSTAAVRLKRVVEMYQWQESEITKVSNKTSGVQKDYDYDAAWSPEPVNSAAFHHPQGHANPPMPYRGEELSASAAKIGGITLSAKAIEQINEYRDYALTQDDFAKINPELTRKFTLHDGEYYGGDNPGKPAVGDVRVRYQIIAPGDRVGVTGIQVGDRLEEASEVSKPKIQTPVAIFWGLRFCGWLAMCFSLVLVLKSVQTYGEKSKVLASMAAFGLRMIAIVVATALTLITIAVLWFSHSPAVSIGLLCGASAVIIASTFVKRKKEEEAPIPVAVKYFKVPRQAQEAHREPPRIPHIQAGAL